MSRIVGMFLNQETARWFEVVTCVDGFAVRDEHGERRGTFDREEEALAFANQLAGVRR